MARLSAIPENLIIPLMEQYDNGLSDTELVEWLKKEHNLEVSRMVVQNRLKPFRDLAQQAKRDAIASRAGDRAMDYLSIMDKDIGKLDKLTDRMFADSAIKPDLNLARQLIETKLKIIAKQLDVTGINKEEKDQSDQEDMLSRILAKIPKLELVESKEENEEKKAG